MGVGFSVENGNFFFFLPAEKYYCIFSIFFPSVTVLKAVCQRLVLILCSPVNSKSFNRYLSWRWTVYISVCQNATFYTEQHQHSCITMPYFWWLWQLRQAPDKIVSTCSGTQASPGDSESQATSNCLDHCWQGQYWIAVTDDSLHLLSLWNISSDWDRNSSRGKFSIHYILLMFPWRQKLRTATESEFRQTHFWGAEGICSEGHRPPQPCSISHHSSYLVPGD